MIPSSTDFIQAVWDELEATGPTDFAKKLGLGVDGLQKVRRWRKGGRLDYEDVMAMLERTGWFTMPAGELPKVAHTDQPAPADPLAALASAVAKLELAQAEILAEARASRAAREAAQSQPPARPKRNSG